MKTGEVQLTEAALLGACLLNHKAALIAGDYVTASDFYAPKHQIIWDAIIGIMASGADPDPVSVAAALGNRVEEAGGQTYVLTLPSLCPSVSNVRQYAQAIRGAATDRRVRAEINDALGKLEGEELLAVIQERMYQIDRRVERATTMTDIWERMKANGTNPLPPDASIRGSRSSGVPGVCVPAGCAFWLASRRTARPPPRSRSRSATCNTASGSSFSAWRWVGRRSGCGSRSTGASAPTATTRAV